MNYQLCYGDYPQDAPKYQKGTIYIERVIKIISYPQVVIKMSKRTYIYRGVNQQHY